MTASQSLKLFKIASKYFNNQDDATVFVSEIEAVVDNKIEQREEVLATKRDIADLRKELAESKADMIKWMFIFWFGQIGATVGLIFLFVKR